MNTLFIGKNFVELGSVNSTNTFAAMLLDSQPADGTVVLAQNQTGGRGQKGSVWLADAGLNLTFSIVLYPRFLFSRQIFLLNKLIACALRDTVENLLPGREILIKWPNDLLVDRKKISGILIETNLEQDNVRAAIIGIGLNVNQVEFDASIYGRATSLAAIAGHTFGQRKVLDQVLENIEAGYLALRAGRHDGIERAYLQHLYAYQEDCMVAIDGDTRKVHIVGVDPHGRLAVQEGGKLYFYGLKEIQFLL